MKQRWQYQKACKQGQGWLKLIRYKGQTYFPSPSPQQSSWLTRQCHDQIRVLQNVFILGNVSPLQGCFSYIIQSMTMKSLQCQQLTIIIKLYPTKVLHLTNFFINKYFYCSKTFVLIAEGVGRMTFVPYYFQNLIIPILVYMLFGTAIPTSL